MKKEMKRLGLLAVLALAGSSANAWADAVATPAATPAPTVAAPVVTVGGLVDTYYTVNFTNNANNVHPGNIGTFFNTTDGAFALNMAELNLAAAQGPAAAHLTLNYGQETNLGLGTGTSGLDVLQAYLSYTAGQWTFTGGRFVTWMGNEVIESKSNWNYSRSLLFWYTIPLWHTGVSVGYSTADSKLGITGYATDGWNTTADVNTAGQVGNKTYGLQVSIKPDATWNLLLNGIAGSNSPTDANAKYVGEAILSLTASDKLSFALDAEYGGLDVTAAPGDTFWGVALYGRDQFSSDWAGVLRLEELNDKGFVGFGTPTVSGEAREVTLTIEHNLSANLLLRLEGRYDYALSNGTTLSATTTPAGPYAGASGDQLTTTLGAMMSF